MARLVFRAATLWNRIQVACEPLSMAFMWLGLAIGYAIALLRWYWPAW